MVAGFHSFHWKDTELPDGELDDAFGELTGPTDGEAHLAAFRTLLLSGHTAAAGIALDHYQRAESFTRWGAGNDFEPLGDEVRAVARALLAQPPLPRSDENVEAANHASALVALTNLAEARDADLIADALAATPSADVRACGLTTAGTALADAHDVSPRLVAVLAGIITDEEADTSDRTSALAALDATDTPEVVDLLLRATEAGDVTVQAAAAYQLTMYDRLDAHREHLERLAATWPPDARGWPSVARDAIAGD